jgi:hypothetical protein
MVSPSRTYVHPDWSYAVSVAGKEMTLRKPDHFPLEANKTWKIQWEDTIGNAAFKLERNELVYRVTGWEDVSVPVGKFRAIKVEAEVRGVGSISRKVRPFRPTSTRACPAPRSNP